MLSKKEVKHIAQLSRIKLSEEEVKKYQQQLSVILDYFKEIQKVETKNILPMANTSGIKNVFRQDKPILESGERRKKLIEAAPSKEKNFIKVKEVFDQRF